MGNNLNKIFVFTLLLIILIGFYQNCSEVNFSLDENSTSNPAQVELETNQSCDFDGKKINNGDSITAFANRTTPRGSSCNSIERLCRNGVLEGSTSFIYSTCSVESGKSCSAKTIRYANNSCLANLTSAQEGSEQSFNCPNGEQVSQYICDQPYRFDGTRVSRGEASLKVTCSAGEWTPSETFNTAGSCYRSGDLYDCYLWIYGGTNGQILRASDTTKTFNDVTMDFNPSYPAPVSSCCSKKIELRECQDMGSGNKSCKAFCVE